MPFSQFNPKDLKKAMNLVSFCEECPDALIKKIVFEYKNNLMFTNRLFSAFKATNLDELAHKMIDFYRKNYF